MCVYIYIYIYIHIHTHTHTHVYTMIIILISSTTLMVSALRSLRTTPCCFLPRPGPPGELIMYTMI